jgi:hypothetical protein
VNGAAAGGDIDGKTDTSNAREHMSQSGSRASFNAGNPVPRFLASFFSIRNLCASRGLPDNRMIANDEVQMLNDEGMTKIRMPNLCESVQSSWWISEIEGKAVKGSGERVGKRASFNSADDHLRDLCVLCGEK